jgi:hypothetical protein
MRTTFSTPKAELAASAEATTPIPQRMGIGAGAQRNTFCRRAIGGNLRFKCSDLGAEIKLTAVRMACRPQQCYSVALF